MTVRDNIGIGQDQVGLLQDKLQELQRSAWQGAFRGLYPYARVDYLKRILSEADSDASDSITYRYLNSQNDTGDDGLRTVKQRYRPIEWRKKWRLVGGVKSNESQADADHDQVQKKKEEASFFGVAEAMLPHESTAEPDEEPELAAAVALQTSMLQVQQCVPVEVASALYTDTLPHQPGMCMYMLKSACLANRCGVRLRVAC